MGTKGSVSGADGSNYKHDIYKLWSQVLDYFDAFLIGLTATPTKKTIGYFHQNVVSEYTHEDAVIDRVNVGYDIYRIKTEKTEQGGLIEANTNVEIRDRVTKVPEACCQPMTTNRSAI